MALCPNCNGDGSLPPWGPVRSPEQCPSCRGKGEVAPGMAHWWKCRRCDGYGWIGYEIAPQRCPRCHGLGIVPPRR